MAKRRTKARSDVVHNMRLALDAVKDEEYFAALDYLELAAFELAEARREVAGQAEAMAVGDEEMSAVERRRLRERLGI